MYNLLVSGGTEWGASRGTMDRSRTLEYTVPYVKERFAPQGILDVRAVTELPTVFAQESGRDGGNLSARVGTLTRVERVGSNYQLEYVLDRDIPPIPNSVLFHLAAHELDVDTTASIPENLRTHWSIKDVDLFKVLLKRQIEQRPKPRVFHLSEGVTNPNLVAVMMPFDAEFNLTYEALKVAIGELGMECKRADDLWVNDHVIQDIALLLCQASIVVCDLSRRNANVFYETGIAHTLGRNVILIAQSESDIPFDVAAIRHIRYLANGEGVKELGAELKSRIQTLRESR